MHDFYEFASEHPVLVFLLFMTVFDCILSSIESIFKRRK